MFSSLYAQKPATNGSFSSPLKPPFLFAGNFGELRPVHFHSGLDFRTQGRTGLPVYAVKDGYISRIGISTTGYGNALYMNHPDGTTSVYGHLERFQPRIQEYVKNKQYESESFLINLTVSSGEFNFKKGEIIAWSGNSGSSGGPHLHFEIRNTKSERAYNPVFYIPGIRDNSAPKIKALYVYPLNDNSFVGKVNSKKRYETVTVPGGYRIPGNAVIELSGKIGFGIQADDDFNGAGFRCGIFSATLLCDGKQVFGFKMDNFSFDDMRYANSQADYEEYQHTKRWVHRLYRQPGNHLDIYEPADKNGILNMEDRKAHEFEVIISDAFNNKVNLKFRTMGSKIHSKTENQKITAHFQYDDSNQFENDELRVNMPKGALYDNLGFIWKSGPKSAGYYSAVEQVSSKYVPLQLPYSLSIKCESLPDNLRSKALIVAIDPKTKQKAAVGGEYSGGWVTVKTYLFGSFAVAIDITPPVITPINIKGEKDPGNKTKMIFRIGDNLSGIKSWRGEIDGEWALFEYEAKTGILTYTFDKRRVTFGKSHLLRLIVTDNKGNSAVYKSIIYK